MNKSSFNQKTFIKFIIKAKQNTYAKSGEAGEKILADSSKELVFKEGDFKYRDRYFGFDPFIGEEIVFQNSKVVWGMNYYGRIISRIISAKQVYQFLRKALKRVVKDKHFRGLDGFVDHDFRYANKSEGSIENFKGQEKIFYKQKLVYRLDYNGGVIFNC